MANGKGWRTLAISSSVLAMMIAAGIIIIYWWSSTTVVLLVRHAERDDSRSCDTPPSPTPNPPISAAGETRRDVLAHVAEDTGLQAIYASEACRTQQTVAAISGNLGIPSNNISQHNSDGTANVDALVELIKTNNEGQKILVAGHTETVPLIIEKLGGGTIPPITSSEFDNLYVVTIVKWRWFFNRTTVVRLKYGAQSPP